MRVIGSRAGLSGLSPQKQPKKIASPELMVRKAAPTKLNASLKGEYISAAEHQKRAGPASAAIAAYQTVDASLEREKVSKILSLSIYV